MSPISTLHLHTIFKKLDKNGDGLVSLDELMWLLDKIGVCASQDEVRVLVGKDTLDPVDFLFFYQTLSIKGNVDIALQKYEADKNDENMESDLRKAFRVFDLNGDGFISSEELEGALSKLGLWDECCGTDCKSMIGVYDVNEDGLLDFEEFKIMMSA